MIPAMDEKSNMPTSSCETHRHVLDSPKSKPEMCEKTEYLDIPSTSASKNIPILSLESMPNIESKGVVKRVLRLPSTVDNILHDATKSINLSVNQLSVEEKECKRHLYAMEEEYEMLSNYLINPILLPEVSDHELKSLIASRKLIDAEKTKSTLLSLIEQTLISIKVKLDIIPSVESGIQEALKSLNKSIIEMVPKYEEHKADLTTIEESLEENLPRQPAADNKRVRYIRNLIHFVESSIAELGGPLMAIKELLRSIKELPSQNNIFPKLENSGDTDKNPGTL